MARIGLLHYVTPKYVVLSDRRLGLIYYILVGLILLFTLFELFLWKGYLDFDTNPHGTIRLLVKDELDAPPTYDVDLLPYCRDGIECNFMDSQEMTWPWDSRALTITTRAKDKWQRLHSSHVTEGNEDSERAQKSFQEEGTIYEDISEEEYFTVNPEYVLLKVDHSVVATRFTDERGQEALAASHRLMNGYLLNSDGSVIRQMTGKDGKPDKITVKELLMAAGVDSLENITDSISGNGESFRRRGCVLRVSIRYDNWRRTWFGTTDIEYSYFVRRVPYVDYVIKEVQPVRDIHTVGEKIHFLSSPIYRLQRKRYAVRIEFEQSGSLGMFSASSLVIKLASSIGLLTLTATLIECLALYVLPNKNNYREQIIDMSTIEKGATEKKKREGAKEL